jgi:hypothetical protein
MLLQKKAVSLASMLAISLIMFLAPRAGAQNANTGEIKGSVTDPSGALVPGATVSIRNVQTGVVTPTTTNGSGLYDVPFLTPGNYTITFSNPGFRNVVREGIVLQIETLEIDAALQVGVSTQEVVVNATAPVLETDTSDQHVDLSAQTVITAPVVGTDWRNELTQLIPGVNTGGGNGEANGQGVGVNGTQGYNINFLIDGSAATAPRDYNSSNNYIPLDAIAEISMSASNAPAQYGNGLTSVNVITKSGTNEFHGSAFESVENTALNARGFYNQTGPKSVTHWNNYGGSLGGPIIKNKLLFFFAYQRNPSSTPTSGLYSYPTAAMQAGDFYGITGSTGSAFSPNGTLLGTYDPVALKLQSYFPKASATGWIGGCPGPANVGPGVDQTCPGINNFVFNGSAPNTSTWYTGKIDYNISDNQKLSFSFNYYPNFVTYVPEDPLYPSDATTQAQGNNYNFTGQLSYVYTIGPTMVNEFRVGGVRELDSYLPPSLGKGDPTTLGFEPTYGTNMPANMFPVITIDQGAGGGCYALGAGCGENGNIDAVLGSGTYNASDILTLVRGRHTIKVGGELDKAYQNYTGWPGLMSGSFEFNGGVSGIPYADFLSGDVYGWYVYEADETGATVWNGAAFATDDFKISSHVMLNLGLRWQYQGGWGVYHNLFGIYDPILPNSASAGATGGILYGGQSDTKYGGSISNLSTIENADWKEFAPRVGVAWSPREKWSIRASFGMFDAPRDAENYTDGALGLGFNPHNVGNGGYVNGSSAFKLAVGPPPGTVIFPTAQTLSSTVSNYSSVEYYPRNMPTDYITNALVSVQRELPAGMLVDTQYVYTRGTNLNFATDINQPHAGDLGCTTYNCGNPNPIFNSIAAQTYDGWSNYNALQIRLQKRLTYGLQFQMNYSWSKSLDTGTGNGHGSGVDIYQNAYSPAANYGLSDFNAANTVTGQIAYEVPFGVGRRFALHGLADQVLGGWRVSSVFQYHSGTPFTPVIQSSVRGNIDPALGSAGTTLYPELVGNPYVSNPTNGEWFNPAAFADPAYGTFGDSGRNILVGPGFSNVDLSFAKTFLLHWEGIRLSIRADAYNAFNHVDYSNPDGDVGYTCSAAVIASGALCGANNGILTDGASGRITGPSNGQRVIQLGARLTF